MYIIEFELKKNGKSIKLKRRKKTCMRHMSRHNLMNTTKIPYYYTILIGKEPHNLLDERKFMQCHVNHAEVESNTKEKLLNG